MLNPLRPGGSVGVHRGGALETWSECFILAFHVPFVARDSGAPPADPEGESPSAVRLKELVQGGPKSMLGL